MIKQSILAIAVLGIILYVPRAPLFAQQSGRDLYLLREMSLGERKPDEVDNIKHPTTDTRLFKLWVERWIAEAGLQKRFGLRDVLRRGTVVFGAVKDQIAIGIIPKGRQRQLDKNGLYEDGVEFTEGVYGLYQALKKFGYQTEIRKGQVGIWTTHVYLEAQVGGRTVRINTVPGISIFDFEAANQSSFPAEKAQEEFEASGKMVPFGNDAFPITAFTSREGKSVVICAGLIPVIFRNHTGSSRVDFYCLAFISGPDGKTERSEFVINCNYSELGKLYNLARAISEGERDITFDILKTAARREGLRFLQFESNARQDDTASEVAAEISRILYYMITSIDLRSASRAFSKVLFAGSAK